MLAAPLALATSALSQQISTGADSGADAGLFFEAASVKPASGRSLCNLDITPGRLTAATVSPVKPFNDVTQTGLGWAK
jgi:hypothetical protein